MILFPIDVRNRICKKYDKWMDYVRVESELKILLENEINIEAYNKLEEAKKLIHEIEEIMKEELKKEMHDFEIEYVKEIFHFEEYYKTVIEDK